MCLLQFVRVAPGEAAVVIFAAIAAPRGLTDQTVVARRAHVAELAGMGAVGVRV